MISAGLLVLALVVSAEAAAIVVGVVIVFWAIGMVGHGRAHGHWPPQG